MPPLKWHVYGYSLMRERIINIVFAADCFVFTLLTLGKAYPFESFSSAAYRGEKLGLFYGKARPRIDWLAALVGDYDHCRKAYERAKLNLPPDQRG